MSKYDEWRKDFWDDPESRQTWNAAIDAAMETAINAAHPNDWIRIGMALEKLKS